MSDFFNSYSMVIGLLIAAARVLSFPRTQSLEDLSFALLSGRFQLLDLFMNDTCEAKSTRSGRNTCKILFGMFTFFSIPQQKLHWLENFALDSLDSN